MRDPQARLMQPSSRSMALEEAVHGEQSAARQESEWVARSQRGDALAFNRLVLRWEKPIYNLSLRMLQDPDEAAETTQEVFLAAFKSIRRFRRDARFSTWLYRIAVNQCLTRLRHRPPGTHLALEDRDAARLHVRESHEAEIIDREKRRHVRRALAFLQPDQRAVVELKFFQDQTFEEIAAVLDAPLSTVKSRLYAGLEMLKARLGGAASELAGR